jgi:DNA-binding LytR/AlgR family response regulator
MRVLIADDEPVARQVLRELLAEHPGVEVVGEAADGVAALEQASRLQPDAIFLDLQMPGLGGFAVARSLRRSPLPVVVYVTAYDAHALEAFETGATDYLLKPVRPARLAVALERVRALLQRQKPPVLDKIVGRAGSTLHLFDPGEVIAFLAEGDVVYLVSDKQRCYCDDSLRSLEKRLPADRFRRVHRAAIINTAHIRTIAPLSSKRWRLKMSNGLEVVVSKRQAAFVRGGIR